jgi:hypothetical protein
MPGLDGAARDPFLIVCHPQWKLEERELKAITKRASFPDRLTRAILRESNRRKYNG